jgi:hypothetical protein
MGDGIGRKGISQNHFQADRPLFKGIRQVAA